MVDVIFADVAQPDQTRIVALNAHNFLKNGGHFVISIKVKLHLCRFYFFFFSDWSHWFEAQSSDDLKPDLINVSS